MPASSRGYVNRAVTGNEQISPPSPRADVDIGPCKNVAEVPSAGGDARIAPLGTSPERSEKANTSVPLAPTDQNAQMFRRMACSAPHPAGLRPATLSHGGRLWGKIPLPVCNAHGRGNILPHRPVPGVAGEEAEDGEYLQSAQQHIENQDQFAQRTEAGEVAGGSHSLKARADVIEAAQDG